MDGSAFCTSRNCGTTIRSWRRAVYYACGYVIHTRGRLASFLGHLGLPRLGRISYSYYLCHGLVLKSLYVLLKMLRPQTSPSLAVFWMGMPVAYACTLIVGWSWFHVVEVRLAALFAKTPAPRVAVPSIHSPLRHRLPDMPTA